MPLPRAVPVTLTGAERTTLNNRARGAKTAYRDRLRAQIVLAAARGRDNARIAADLRITADTVRKWRGRFAARGLAGLADLPRCGRPRRISELTRAAVVALACQLPAATGVPLSRWTGPELLAELTGRGGGCAVGVLGAADLGRASGQALAVPVLDLPPRPGLHREGGGDPGPVAGALPGHAAAAGRPDPVRGRQALHPGPRPLPSHLAAARGRPVRVEHEYVRHGALALLAALDVRTGKVLAATPDTTGITPFTDLIGQVMSRPEYKDAPRVFVIVDNGSGHRGQAAASRLRDA